MFCDNVITLAHSSEEIDSVKSPNVTYNVILSFGMTITTLEDLEFKTYLSAR